MVDADELADDDRGRGGRLRCSLSSSSDEWRSSGTPRHSDGGLGDGSELKDGLNDLSVGVFMPPYASWEK